MATYSSIFCPAGASTAGSATADKQGTITAGASSAEIVFAPRMLFAINASGDVNIRFGTSGMPAAANTDFRIPAGTTATYELGETFDRIRLFNNGAGTITYWIQPLTKT